jgi:hypothetical protein
MPGARTDIDHGAGRLEVQRLLDERAGQAAKVPGAEERLTRLDHLGRVPVAGDEVDVALLGDVERVPLAAPERPVAGLERPAAYGAPKEVDRVC